MSKKSKKNPKQPVSTTPWFTLELKGFLQIAGGIGLGISLVSFAWDPYPQNLLGLVGHGVGWIGHSLFGLSSYLLVFYWIWLGWRGVLSQPVEQPFFKNVSFFTTMCSLSFLLSVGEVEFSGFQQWVSQLFYPGLLAKKQMYHLGGAPFFYLYKDFPFFNLRTTFNSFGVFFFSVFGFISGLLLLFEQTPLAWLQRVWQKNDSDLSLATESVSGVSAPSPPESDLLRFVKLRTPSFPMESTLKSSPAIDLLHIQPEQNPKERPSLSKKGGHEPFDGGSTSLTTGSTPAVLPKEVKPQILLQRLSSSKPGDFSSYQIPHPDFLTNAKKNDSSSLKKDLKKQAEVLEETLMSFGIEAKVGQINCGPTITSFEVHPAIGVKVQKIKTLEDDIALNMEAKSIRILAPIPGKAAVGIEVPNSQPQEVGFKEMLLAYQQTGRPFHIPILLGKAVNGDYVMSDLTKMPHCIIAGATGSGKSVCINTIIVSILLNAKPDQIKLLMVDPKKVELTPYTRLPHMLAPVITEPQGAAAALKWLVKEMEVRYEILKLLGVRNIDTFNKRTIQPEVEATLEREIPPHMPYIVCIIDELADLMMVASQDIETPIARIAQMARAVGIHLILATQRPSREVITGLIKANFPTRIAFKVASRVNSQIILDDVGAESLLGNGDLLFLPPGSSHLIRAQGAFVRDEDIQKLIQTICSQAPPNYLIQSFDHPHLLEESLDEESASSADPLLKEAKDIVLSTGNASTTFLQRKLKIGYARAASLMDLLEKQGLVGPAEGSKPRKIFKPSLGNANELNSSDEL